MPLDQFRTQVLLLHSEQSALDSLSSGFDDRYTVHCATSGSEALTTLGETPINVIISAQNLPGMSGAEALREAKKRSPETIGILLVGASDQALVGAKDMFQVVRGEVTSESLKKLVDGATQQMRLMALAESANDTAANPDEPAEHIIMETSENGSSIISDGTGQFPSLNPQKVSAAASVGSKSVDVLVLTKDQEFLTTIKESSRGVHEVHYANTLKQADELIRKHKVGVAVVDAAMVGDKVEQLTLHLRKGSPRLVSIVAGRRDDGEMLMDLINRGKVYRFLLKPVSPGRARLAVEASVKHHLEAPDAAFKAKAPPGAASKPAPQSSAPPKPAPRPRVEQKPQPKPQPPAAKPTPAPSAPKPAAASRPAAAPKPAPADPPLGEPAKGSPVDDGLSAAFGGDDSGFTETMTGIISSVGKKFKGDKKEPVVPGLGDTLAGLESPVASGGGASSSTSVKIVAIAITAVVVVAAGAFWFSGGEDESVPAPQEPVATPAPAPVEADSGFDSETVVAVDVDAELARAETALLESRLDDASAALQTVADVEPDHPRLPFLSAQLSQLQLRGYIADARAAIRDTRFEDAGNALAAARSLGLSDSSEIDAVMEELANARSEQRVDETLALASARLEEGDMLSPPNDNARYYYELVLSSDPTNAAARQGLNVIAGRLALQARGEIDAGNLRSAENLLADARAIDASNAELTSTEAALQSAREAIAERERLAEEARAQAQADRKAEAERQAAARRTEEQRLADEQAAAAAAAQTSAATKPPAEAVSPPVEEARRSVDEASAPVEDTATSVETPAAQAVSALAEPVPVSEQKPVAISTLTRTKYVAPRYPRAAQRRGDSGWVDVVFTVTLDGSVTDVEARNSQPEGVFDNAAIRAVEKWTFEPVIENGQAVEKRAGVRMMFAIE